MAIDTREKRAAAIAFRLPFLPLGLPPDGSIDEPERAFSVHTYSGIDIDEGGGPFYPPTDSAEEVAFSRPSTRDQVQGTCSGVMGPEG